MTKRPAKARRPNLTGRSTGPERYVRLFHWTLKSDAYRTLPIGPRALLIELMALYNGRNNGELFLSVREAASRLNVSKNFAARCFSDLRERGFIRPNRIGAFNLKSNARRGMATTWILTEYPMGNETSGTKDFMKWRSKYGATGQESRGVTVPPEGPSLAAVPN